MDRSEAFVIEGGESCGAPGYLFKTLESIEMIYLFNIVTIQINNIKIHVFLRTRNIFCIFQTYTDMSLFANTFLSELNNLEEIKPIILGAEWDDTIACKGFVLIAENYTSARQLLSRIPRYGEHRIALVLRGSTISLTKVTMVSSRVSRLILSIAPRPVSCSLGSRGIPGYIIYFLSNKITIISPYEMILICI